jgi:hypothetical protein
MFKTVSGIAFIVIAILMALQAFPVPGIFLMMLGGPIWTGILVHVFLLSLAIEGWVGRIPRALVAIPLIAYGSYYALYIYQTIDMAVVSAGLRKSNSGKIVDFNSDIYSLVTPTARALVGSHVIAVAYEANANFQPEQHQSFRLVRRDQCNLASDSLHRIQTSSVFIGNMMLDKACMLSVPESPPQKVISVVKIGDEEVWKRDRGIGEQTHQLMLDGKIVGIYKTASVWRLPIFPSLAIGCGLISSAPAWKCAADFMRSYTVLDTVPDGIDRERFDGPESVMLGLPKYTAADLANYRGYPQNEAALAWLADEPQRVEDHMFALLQELAGGGYPKVPMLIGFSVAKNPARLTPLAEAMANRFIELGNIRPTNGDGQEYNYRYEGLATALTKLPDEAFAKVAAPLYAYFVEGMSSSFGSFSELRDRTERAAGPQKLEFYETDFMTAKGYRRLFPVLAICRIGRASQAVIAEMKAELIQGSNSSSFNEDNKTALIVTLLKLQEDDFVRTNKSVFVANAQADFAGWFDAILSSKGATAVGPNNCMTKDWNGRRANKPSLSLMRGVWIVGPN